ncbi:MAG: zinc-dependent metalloprotease [Bacteroidia bacterium]|nr:zinc-dependent metalloprotease [Bacteroidia bacterium]
MKKRLPIVVTLLCLLQSMAILAQSDTLCGFDHLLQNEPDYLAIRQSHLQRVTQFRANNTVQFLPNGSPMGAMQTTSLYSCRKAKYLIPVVVHIVYNSGEPASNISDAQVESAIRALNSHFSNDVNAAYPAVNTGIQFCLAKKMPNGTSFSGITRQQNNTLSNHHFPADAQNLMALDYFPAEQYLNVWVVQTILNNNGGDNGVGGYASTPGVLGRQGIVVRYKRMGNVSDCISCSLHSDTYGATLAHEAGHYFGLNHPFDGGCTGMTSSTCETEGDLCCDVPPVNGQNFGCSTRNTCNETPDSNDQIQNLMDYSNESCRNIFTADQTEIMYSVLSTIRRNLVSPFNINNVGLSCCHTAAVFDISSDLACLPSDSVILTAIKYSGATYRWYISKGGTLVQYTSDTNYFLKYTPSIAGFYAVKLTVVQSGDSVSDTRVDYFEALNCNNPISNPQAAWAFGEYCGLRFTSGGAVRDAGPQINKPQNINTLESNISQGNAAGQMLFYGGGIDINLTGIPLLEIYNKEYKKMNGSDSMYGHYSSTQVGLSIPFPGNGSRYYIVHGVFLDTLNTPSFSGLRYSVIDTTLDSGKGGVVSTLKNKPIIAPSFISYISDFDSAIIPGEAMTTIPKCNGNDYWLIVQEGVEKDSLVFDSTHQRLLVYSVTSTGISYHSAYVPERVISRFGALKASPDGKYLAGWGRLFSFDRETGTITGTIFDIGQAMTYGVCFSPDSRLLYFVQDYIVTSCNLMQYDIFSANPIPNRKLVAAHTGLYYQLQIGPDGKLYGSSDASNKLRIINSPNLRDTIQNACDYNNNGPLLSANGFSRSRFSLPNLVNAKAVDELSIGFDVIPVSCLKKQFRSGILCAGSYKWYFGDGDSSSLKDPDHLYSIPGSYTVQLITPDTSISQTISVGVFAVEIGGDSLFCDTGMAVNYSTTHSSDFTYQWDIITGSGTFSSSPNEYNPFVAWSSDSGSIRVIVTDLRSGCTDTAYHSVALQPKMIGNYIGSSQTICDTLDIIPFIGNHVTGGIGTITYQWRKKLPTSPSWTNIPSSNDTTYLPTTFVDSTMYVRVAISGKCENISDTVLLRTKADSNTITLISRACIASDNYTVNGSTPHAYQDTILNYQWEYSIDSSSWSNITDADSIHLHWSFNGDSVYVRRKIDMTSGCSYQSNVLKLRPFIYFVRHPRPRPTCRFHTSSSSMFFDDLEMHTDTNVSLHYFWELKQDGSSSPWNDTSTWNPTYDTSARNFISYGSTWPRVDSLRCIVFTPCGKVYSKIVPIYTNYPEQGLSYSLSSNPGLITVDEGDTAIFTITEPVPGSEYYWDISKDGGENWDTILNEHNDTLLQFNVNRCDNKSKYRARVFNGCELMESQPGMITVNYSFKDSLMMRDATNDTGVEPYPNNNIWASPDIWFSRSSSATYDYNNDNIEYKKLTPIGYAKVQVKNTGSTTSPAQKVVVHWTIASTLELWPKHWLSTPDNIFVNGPDTFFRGGVIDTVVIGPMTAGSTQVIVLPWEVPNPAWYGVSGIDSSLMVCLLARIITCDEKPYGMTFPEGLVTATNVRNNRKIITRNFHVVDTASGDMQGKPWVGNYLNQNSHVAFNLKAKSCNYFDYGVVEVVLDTPLSQAWYVNGAHGSGFTVVDDYTIRITDSCDVWMTDVAFAPNEEDHIKIHFVTDESYERTSPMSFDFEFYQYHQDSTVIDTPLAEGAMMLRCDLPDNTALHYLDNQITSDAGTPYRDAVCSGGTAPYLTGSSPVTPAFWTYQWQQCVDTTNNSWTDIAGATDKDYQPTENTVTKYYRRGALKQHALDLNYTPAFMVRLRNPMVTLNPANTSVTEGDIAQFTVAYQDLQIIGWQRNNATGNVLIPDSSDTLNYATFGCNNGNTFQAKLRNVCDNSEVLSTAASLTVTAVYGNLQARDNTSGSFIWNSPDLWNRRSNDAGSSHETPLFGAANYLRTFVRNNGTSTSAPAKLYLYWSVATTGAQWERNLKYDTTQSETAGNWKTYDGTKRGLGNLIGVYDIPALAVDSAYTVNTTWYPVDPAIVTGDPDNDDAEINLLARIVTCNDAPFGMDNTETLDLGDNVRDNNRIIAKNYVVAKVIPGNDVVHIAGNGNVADGFASDGKLVFHANNCDYFRYGFVKIHLDATLQSIWTNTDGSGFTVLNDSTLQVDSCQDVVLSNINYDADQRAWAGIEFVAWDTLTNSSTLNLYYEFDLEQFMAGDDYNSVGGIRYGVPMHLEPPPPGHLIARNKPVLSTTNFYAYPNPFTNELKLVYGLPEDGEVSIAITNLVGQKVATIENNTFKQSGVHKFSFNAEALKEGIYFINFTAGSYTQTQKVVLIR